MLEIRRPEPKAALTWTAVWLVALIALIALAMMPLDTATSTAADFAASQDEIHYSHGTYTKPQGAVDYDTKVRG